MILNGTSGKDTLTGGADDDVIDGKAGADSMTGGAGRDTFYVDNVGDVVVELAGGGIDTVYTSLTPYTAPANVEHVIFTGTTAIRFNFTGNAESNSVIGGIGDDVLRGLEGNDTLVGGQGLDVINGGVGDDSMEGGAGDDTLTGEGGNDTLNGGAGIDALRGGAGDDTYWIDNAADVITEVANGGVDTVITSLNVYTLPDNLENLAFAGGASRFNVTGNTAANKITGDIGNDVLRGMAGNDSLFGGQGADNLNGGEGDDAMEGGDGDDILTGEGGNDTLIGGAGADVMKAGAGDDTYYVDNVGDTITEGATAGLDKAITSLATYVLAVNVENLSASGSGPFDFTGNGLNNLIIGAAAADVLRGLAGADTIQGGGGADTLWGGEGDDVLTLGAATGPVKLYGEAGKDKLSSVGATGAATLDGGAGADTLEGGAASDSFYVDDAGDVVSDSGGAASIDTVFTTLQAYTAQAKIENIVFTGTGAFTGRGNDLANSIVGGAGDDTLIGGKGVDTLVGGAGSDRYYVEQIGDLVTESPGDGIDTVVTTLLSYILPDNVENLLGGAEPAGPPPTYTFTGNAANNAITAGSQITVLYGLGGNDALTTDHFNGRATLWGGDGDDTLTATSGMLYGEAGNDVLKSTGNLPTTLDGGEGADTMQGSTGEDTYYIDNAGDVVIEVYSGTTLRDTIRTTLGTITLVKDVEDLYFDGPAGGAFDATGNERGNSIFGGTGDDVIRGLAGDDVLTGGQGADSLSGGEGRDTLDGGSGADTLDGGAGNDTYYVDNALDLLVETSAGGVDTVIARLAAYTLQDNVENLTFAGALAVVGTGNGADNVIRGDLGNDRLSGLDGADTLIGSAGNDSLVGGNGADSLAGDDGADTLIGGEGSDRLDGGVGGDSMIGGGGDDWYVVDNTTDVVVETEGGGVDGVMVSLLSYTLSEHLEHLSLTGEAFNANFTGTGNAANNSMTAANGADILLGLAGNDTLNGGFGSDSLNGGEGDDVLIESQGMDTMTGGAGADTFVFSWYDNSFSNPKVDAITDFQTGIDKIDLRGVLITNAHVIGSAAFSHSIGEIRFAGGVVQIDLNGDGTADRIINAAVTSAGDFIL